MKRAICICVLLQCAAAFGQVTNDSGTARSTYKIGALAATPLSLTNNAGVLELAGLRVSSGTANFSGATITNATLTSGTINGMIIGGSSAAAGTFTTLNTTGLLTVGNGLTVSGGALNLGGADLTNIDVDSGTIDNTVIGGSTRAAGSFTTLDANNGLTVSGGAVSLASASSVNVGTVTAGTINGVAIGGTSQSTGEFTAVVASTGLTVSGGNISLNNRPIQNAAFSTVFTVGASTLVSSLNADRVDSFHIASGGNGGVLYQTTGTMQAGSAGTSGQFLASGGSGAPTWTGLNSAQIFVGNSSNIPQARTLGGEATLSDTGSLTISSGAITPAKLSSGLQDDIFKVAVTIGAESSNTRNVDLQVQDAAGNNQSGVFMFFIVLSDTEDDPDITAVGGAAATPADAGAVWQNYTLFQKYIVFTNSNGLLDIDVSVSGDVTLWLVYSLNGRVDSAELDFN